MMLVWNDAKSFNRHLENMRSFRRRHGSDAKCPTYLLRDMPVSQHVQPRVTSGGACRSLSSRSFVISVPVWKITLPGDIRN
jgi:hypothetical protein